MSRLFTALVVIISWLTPQSIQAYIDYPYTVTFQSIRPILLPVDEEVPKQGDFAFRSSFRWINVWSYQLSRSVFDGEEFQIEPSLRYALTDRIQVGVSVPFKTIGGGTMDSFIESFHRAAGVTQNFRDHYNRNTTNVSYEPFGPYYGFIDNDYLKTYLRQIETRAFPRRHDDPPFDPERLRDFIGSIPEHPDPLRTSPPTEIITMAGEERSGIGDVRTFLQYTFPIHSEWFDTISLGGQIKSEGQSSLYISSPGTDISTFLVLRKKSTPGNFGYRIGISYTDFQHNKFINPDLGHIDYWLIQEGGAYFVYMHTLRLKSYQWVLRPAIEYQFNDWTLEVEYLYFSAFMRHLGDLQSPGHQISFGFKRQVGNYIFRSGIVERFINFGNTPDIGIYASAEVIL